MFTGFLQNKKYFSCLKRFGDKVISPTFHSLNSIINSGIGRHHYDDGRWSVTVESLQELQSVHLRHFQITENEGKRMLLLYGKTLFTVFGNGNLISGL